jgi:hypothetical protein
MKQTILVLVAALQALTANAAPLAPGHALPDLTLQDQHEQRFDVPSRTRFVLFAADKTASELAISVLAAAPKGRVDELGIRYIADISAMPAVITRMFALPALRKQAFQVGLARDAAPVADFPRQSGAVTVIRMLDARIAEISFVRDAATLRQRLELAP